MRPVYRFLFLLFFVGFGNAAFSQEELPYALLNTIQPVHVQEAAVYPNYNVSDIFVDAEGNVYATGFFKGICDFDPGPGESTLQAFSDQDVFVAKFSSLGQLLFVKQATGQTSTGGAIGVTSSGKIIVSGRFRSGLQFEPTSFPMDIYSNGDFDIFMAMYDASTGAFEDAYSLGGWAPDQHRDINIVGNEIYLSGSFAGAVDFDPGAGVTELMEVPGELNHFILKLTDFRTFGFVKHLSGYSIPGIEVNATGIYANGSFFGTIDLDPGAGVTNVTSISGNDVWFAKYDLSGNFVWGKSIGADASYDATPDAAGNVYVTGNFTQLTDFDGGAGVLDITPIDASGDAFLVKYDPNGNFIWAKAWGGSGYDDGSSIVFATPNNMIVSGHFSSPTIDLNPAVENFDVPSNGGTDTFVSAFDADGNFVNGFVFGADSPTYSDAGWTKTNGVGDFVIYGSILGTADFDPSADIFELATGSFDEGFISHYAILDAFPTAQPTSLALTPGTDAVSGTFVAAPADGYVVLRKLGTTAAVAAPKDGYVYQPGMFVGDGTVAYAGAANAFTDNLLAANKSYSYSVFSYNNTGGAINYLTDNALTGTTTTNNLTYSRATDSLALVAFYNATNGPAWTDGTNWLSANPISTWFGVVVSGDRVIGLNLPFNNLEGTLPPIIGNLTALQTVELSDNNLFGALPDEIFDLGTLTELRLADNQLFGVLSPLVGQLTGLQVLDLSNNQFVGPLPDELGTLTALTQLNLHNCEFSGTFPLALTNLTNLNSLDLTLNQFTGSLPTAIGNLVNLQQLSLAANAFEGAIPSEIGNLSNLYYLYLSDNQFSGTIPSSLGALTFCQELHIGGNQLTGVVPTEIGNMTGLYNFVAVNNQLSGDLPASMALIPGLNSVNIASNQITGLPDFSASSVTSLNVEENALTFEDLEPNMTIGIFSYSPQSNFGSTFSEHVLAGESLNLGGYNIGGSNNLYQWRLNGVDVPGETLDTLNRIVGAMDAGAWTLAVTNSLVPGLTLLSNGVNVTVQAEGMFQWSDAGDLTADGSNANLYGGVWGDYDNDGLEDIYTVGVNDTLRSYLYHNNGNGTFSRVADAFEHADGRSGVWGDYNNDGFLDIFIPDASFAASATDGIAAVFRNNQNGTFTKISLGKSAVSGAWIDIDFDGDLDLSTEGDGSTTVTTLFRNDGGDVFTATAPFSVGTQWNGIWLHADDDARPDYYIPSTYQNPLEQKLLMNEGGEFYDGYFLGSLPANPIGGTWTDIDNDGDYDLYTLMPNQESLFFINDGSGGFNQLTATEMIGEPIVAPRGATFADFNNDGYSDLLVSIAGGTQPLGWTLYLNNGNLTFSKVANQTFKPTSNSTGATVADYDNDGDMDIFSASFQGGVSNGLYTNLGTTNHWLKIKLTGTTSNRNAVGARIAVYAEGFGRHHQVLTANGFANQNSLLAHFGLGSATSADSVDIIWPSGRRQRILNLAGDQLHVIEEPTNAPFTGDVAVIDVKQIRGTSDDSEAELGTIGIVDGENNTYIVGDFSGSIDLDPGDGEFILSAPPNTDDSGSDHCFLAKYDPAGNLLWGQHFNVEAGNALWMNALSLDRANNILVAGEFEGTVDFDPGDGVTQLTTPVNGASNSYQGYFAKFDNNGSLSWVKTFEVTGDYSYSNLSDIKADGNNNVIVTGDFYTSTTGTIDLNAGTGTAILTADGTGDDIFLLKYTGEGDYLWHVDINETLQEDEGSIAIDESDNIYFGYSLYDPDLEGSGSLKIVKYDANSNEIWTVNGNSPGYESSRVVVNNDNVFLLGSFDSSITLTGTTGTATLTGGSDETPFVAEFDQAGALHWAKGFETSGYGFLFGLTTTSTNDIVISGMYEGSMDLNPGAETFEQFFPGESTCFIKLSSSGDFIWGFSVQNSYGAHQVRTNGELLAGLGFYGPTDIDPNPTSNIVTPVGRENIMLIRYDINDFVGLSSADSLALKAFYDATGGPGWTNKTNWLAANVKVEQWFGVTVEDNKVVAINLPSNNLTGNIPSDVTILNELHTLNVSGNKIQSVPNLSVMPALTTLNVTANRLDFGSLEPNMPITTFTYANQAALGVADSVLIDVGQPYTITKTTPGTANAYQWARNGTNIPGANSNNYSLASVDKSTMGQFVMKVTNSLVPGLTLTTAPTSILATATVQGKLFAATDVPAINGTMTLLRITTTGGFDTLKVSDVANDGTYLFEKVILDKYQLLGFADTLEHERVLPTYFENKLYWEEADTLEIEGNLSNLDITSYLEPVEEPQGQGLIEGYVVEDDGTGEGGRTKAKKRVSKAGASVRRVEGGGRGEEEQLTLIAYVFTDENGEFSFPHLPEGEYRLNIQYPGYPMDPNSYVTIPIGTALESVKKVEAAVEEGKIIVRNLIITDVWGEQYSVDVFPNPTSEKLKINFGYESSARVINLIDITGREIMKRDGRQRSHEIDVTSLDLGIYLLNISENGQKMKTIRVEIK